MQVTSRYLRIKAPGKAKDKLNPNLRLKMKTNLFLFLDKNYENYLTLYHDLKIRQFFLKIKRWGPPVQNMPKDIN